LWRSAEDCVVLFHEDDGRAFALSQSASAVWRMMDGGRSVADIARQLAVEASADATEVLGDVVALIADLESRGCTELERVARDAPPPAETIACGAWVSPQVEQIVFGACDCSSAGGGVMRNAEGASTPKVHMSTI
jgi:hypothetical protein